MHRPEMSEEELTIIVNKQKDGKAAGINRIKAEVMKHLINNKKIRESLLKAFNHSLDEQVNNRWLES